MILVLLGAPGAGKGTQGDRIATKYGVPRISTGDMFRDMAAAGTPVGLAAKEFWSKGDLVPDDIVIALVQQRITHEDCKNGFLLDGFPRTEYQAVILNCLLDDLDMPIDGAVDYAVDDEELIRRLSGRRTCTNCKATFHMEAAPPKVDGICDKCGAELIQRGDDNPETIKNRLREYAAKTAPLIHFYEDRGQLYRVDANADPSTVFERTLDVVEGVTGRK